MTRKKRGKWTTAWKRGKWALIRYGNWVLLANETDGLYQWRWRPQ